MKEFQNVLKEKNSEKIVLTQTVNKLIEKIKNKQQQKLQKMNKLSQNVNNMLQQI